MIVATVTKEQQEERLKICRACESYKLGICSSCGCLLKLKTLLPNTKCPKDKWKEITKDNEQGV